MASLPFEFDPLATYDVLPEEKGVGGACRLIAGQLFVSLNGILDRWTSMGVIRGQVLYLSRTSIPIGYLDGNRLILQRTGASFTLSLRSD